MSQPHDQPAQKARARGRLGWIVLAVGVAWCAVAITCSALLLPPDEGGGFYLIDHGRTEHYDTRLAAVTPFITIAAVMCVIAVVLTSAQSLLARKRPAGVPMVSTPIGLALAAGFGLLLAGLVPLSVTLMAARPNSTWTSWLVLAPVVLFPAAIVVAGVYAIGKRRRATREARSEPRP